MLPLLAALLGCGAPPPAPPSAPVPAAAPEVPSLAAFHGMAHDGTARDLSHLRGHPTVVWFYPKAATGG